MDDIKLPFFDLALVEYLERLFPDKAPDLSKSEKEVWFAAGAVAPARHLRSLLNNNDLNLLENANVLRR